MNGIVFPEGDETGEPKMAEVTGDAGAPLVVARELFDSLK